MFPTPDPAALTSRLSLPTQGRLRLVLDTDTFNEIDDQYALAYCALAPERLALEAVYAAPFLNDRSRSPGHGMDLSLEEIHRLLQRLGKPSDGFAFGGSDRFIGASAKPVESPAARDLIARAATATASEPLYVATIGAPTNVASALLLDPSLVHRIVVVWLGGQPLHWPHVREFNCEQDPAASRVLLDSGVPLLMVPCMGVASHLLTSLPELQATIAGKNALCDFLVERFATYHTDHFGWAKEIWDVAVPGWLINPSWVESHLEPSPVLTDHLTWSRDPARHPIRIATWVRRNALIPDLLRRLGSA